MREQLFWLSDAEWQRIEPLLPPRRFLKRSMRFNCAPGARVDYLAHYDMDHTRPDRRAAFLSKVEATFSTW